MNIFAALVNSLREVENGSLLDVWNAVKREAEKGDQGSDIADTLDDPDTTPCDPGCP